MRWNKKERTVHTFSPNKTTKPNKQSQQLLCVSVFLCFCVCCFPFSLFLFFMSLSRSRMTTRKKKKNKKNKTQNQHPTPNTHKKKHHEPTNPKKKKTQNAKSNNTSIWGQIARTRLNLSRSWHKGHSHAYNTCSILKSSTKDLSFPIFLLVIQPQP